MFFTCLSGFLKIKKDLTVIPELLLILLMQWMFGYLPQYNFLSKSYFV